MSEGRKRYLGLIRPAWMPSSSKIAVCLSAANLLFMGAWFELYPGTADQYVLEISATPQALIGLWTSIILLTGIFSLGHSWIKQSKWSLPLSVATGFMVAISLRRPALMMVRYYPHIFNQDRVLQSISLPWIYSTLLLISVSIVAWACWKSAAAYRVMRNVLLILSPTPLFFSWTIVRYMHPLPSPPNHHVQVATKSARSPKAIVLVFDEWDFDYGFTSRPSWIHLPEIDRFYREYGAYSQCWPPAGETLRSIPSLATGKHWLGAIPGRDLELLLKDSRSGKWMTWSSADDLFQSVSKLGWQSRMIQSWHVFPQTYLAQRQGLSISHHTDTPGERNPREAYMSFRGSVLRSWTCLFNAFRDYYRMIVPENSVPAKSAMARRMMADLIASAESRRYDLIWAHLPFPHIPAIFDARLGTYLNHPDPSISNLDNMILVDKTLGLLRAQLEDQGDWDQTMVILTADHWQRERVGEHISPNPAKYTTDQGFRVPLLVKWPYQTNAWVVSNPVSNTSIRGMVECVAAGQNFGKSFKMIPPPLGKIGLLQKNHTR